jgi:CBS domain-containing protein
MRPAIGVPEQGEIADVLEAVVQTGCEVVPVTRNGDGPMRVTALITVADLPKLIHLSRSATRGHAVGRSVAELLAVLGRRPARMETVDPRSSLADAWAVMSETRGVHVPVVDGERIVGVVSLKASWEDFPYLSARAGFFS